MNSKEDTVEAIRAFNRFYTVNMGFLSTGYLDSDFSVIETRILFELRTNERMMQSEISQLLHVDKSYLSRIIKRFEKNDLIIRIPSKEDKRASFITLTEKGISIADEQIRLTNEQIGEQISHLSNADCRKLKDSLQTVMNILGKGADENEH